MVKVVSSSIGNLSVPAVGTINTISEIHLLVLYFSTKTVFSLAKVVNVCIEDLSVPTIGAINTFDDPPVTGIYR